MLHSTTERSTIRQRIIGFWAPIDNPIEASIVESRPQARRPRIQEMHSGSSQGVRLETSVVSSRGRLTGRRTSGGHFRRLMDGKCCIKSRTCGTGSRLCSWASCGTTFGSPPIDQEVENDDRAHWHCMPGSLRTCSGSGRARRAQVGDAVSNSRACRSLATSRSSGARHPPATPEDGGFAIGICDFTFSARQLPSRWRPRPRSLPRRLGCEKELPRGTDAPPRQRPLPAFE